MGIREKRLAAEAKKKSLEEQKQSSDAKAKTVSEKRLASEAAQERLASVQPQLALKEQQLEPNIAQPAQEQSILKQHMGDFVGIQGHPLLEKAVTSLMSGTNAGANAFKAGTDAIVQSATPILSADILTAPITYLVNKITGKNYATPDQAMTKLLDDKGIKNPETKSAQAVEFISGSLLETFTPAALAKLAQGGTAFASKIAPFIEEAVSVFAKDIGNQAVGAVTGAVTQLGTEKIATEAGMDPEKAKWLGTATGLVGDVLGSSMPNRNNISPNVAEDLTTPKQKEIMATGDQFNIPLSASQVQKASVGGLAPQRIDQIKAHTSLPKVAVQQTDTLDKTVVLTNEVLTDLGIDVTKDVASNKAMGQMFTKEFLPARQAEVDSWRGQKATVLDDVKIATKKSGEARAAEIAKDSNSPIKTAYDRKVASLKVDILSGNVTAEQAKARMVNLDNAARDAVLNEAYKNTAYVDTKPVVNFLKEEIAKRPGGTYDKLNSTLRTWMTDMELMDIEALEDMRSTVGATLKGDEYKTYGNIGSNINKRTYALISEAIQGNVEKHLGTEGAAKLVEANKNLETLMSDYTVGGLRNILKEVATDPDKLLTDKTMYSKITKMITNADEDVFEQVFNSQTPKGKGIMNDMVVADFVANTNTTKMSPNKVNFELSKRMHKLGLTATPAVKEKVKQYGKFMEVIEANEDFVKNFGSSEMAERGAGKAARFAGGSIAQRAWSSLAGVTQYTKFAKWYENPENRIKVLSLNAKHPNSNAFKSGYAEIMEDLVKEVELAPGKAVQSLKTAPLKATQRTVREEKQKNNTPREEK